MSARRQRKGSRTCTCPAAVLWISAARWKPFFPSARRASRASSRLTKYAVRIPGFIYFLFFDESPR